MTADPFDFHKAAKTASITDKLKGIRPDAGASAPPPLERIDAAAEHHGFVARELPRQRPTRRRDVGPTLPINIRAPERVAIPFIRFCEQNRYTYWEGLEELMRQCGAGEE
jgi:hypothetical protein